MISGLVTTLVAPILFQRSGDATNVSRNNNVFRQTWIIATTALATTIAASLLVGFFHEVIFKALVGNEYRSVSYLLPWMTLANNLFATGQILSLKLMSDLNTQALVWPKIATSVVGAILCFGCRYIWGLIGAVAAAVTFSVLQLVWLGWLGWQPTIAKS
jgi:O-antigen/teichoic acid export membrane protein